MTQPLYTIRGREIGPKDLETIRGCIHEKWTLGRTAIFKALCREWDWKQPNGWLKDRDCRDVLLELEKKGEIELPPRLSQAPGGKKHVTTQEHLFVDQSSLEGKVSNKPPSSDAPFSKPKKRTKKKRKRGAWKGHKGHRQELLEPTYKEHVHITECPCCGGREFKDKEMENLWVFLHQNGVEPTNNHAERMIRYAVLWRKRSLGTQSEKGNGKSSFEVLVDAMSSYFKGQQPDLSWIGAK